MNIFGMYKAFTISKKIDLAVSYKRQGYIRQARELLENTIEHCQQQRNTPEISLGALYKSLAKLDYVEGKIQKAKNSYIAANKHYSKANRVDLTEACFFHLGCCSDEFIGSPYYGSYLHGLNYGSTTRPGESGDAIPASLVIMLTKKGVDIYNANFRVLEYAWDIDCSAVF